MNLRLTLDPLLQSTHVMDIQHPSCVSFHKWLLDGPTQMVDVQPEIRNTICLNTIDQPSHHKSVLQPC